MVTEFFLVICKLLVSNHEPRLVNPTLWTGELFVQFFFLMQSYMCSLCTNGGKMELTGNTFPLSRQGTSIWVYLPQKMLFKICLTACNSTFCTPLGNFLNICLFGNRKLLKEHLLVGLGSGSMDMESDLM